MAPCGAPWSCKVKEVGQVGSTFALAAVLALASCGLDFDRFAPTNAADGSPDDASGMTLEASSDDAAPSAEASPGNEGGPGAADAASDGGAALNGSVLCGPNGTNACRANEPCDPSFGCVACTSALQCSASTPFCLRGSCVACEGKADCTMGLACWPSSHTCRAACTGNQAQTCSRSTPICNMGSGACVGCNQSGDCGQGAMVCDPTTQQCVQCATDSDCSGARPRCLASRGQCVGCLAGSDCPPATPVCNPQGFACTAGTCADGTIACPGSTPCCMAQGSPGYGACLPQSSCR
jgi:hypothetical protein